MIRRPPRSTLTTHSFPTRRSSDLLAALDEGQRLQPVAQHRRQLITHRLGRAGHRIAEPLLHRGRAPFEEILRVARSEEHTSELQSLMRISYAVFCLKNTKPTKNTTTIPHSYNK